MDNTEDGHAVLDEGDVHGEAATFLDEFLGAVERIDQPEAAAEGGGIGEFAFLGDDGDLRVASGERVEDEVMGGEIGLGEG
jgi:hypothetical protein